MASIVHRYQTYYVSYTIPKGLSKEFYEKNGLPYDEHKSKRQMWEPFNNLDAAEERRKKVEIQLEEIRQSNGKINHLSVIRPIKLWDFVMKEFIPSRAKSWQPKTYTMNVGLLTNHVKPHLGEKTIQSVTEGDIRELYETLQHTPKGAYKGGICLLSEAEMEKPHEESKCLGPTTIHDVALLLGGIFKLALRRNLITEDPLPEYIPPRNEDIQFKIWDDVLMKKALASMPDQPLLRLAIHLAYVGALRNGETVGISLEELDLKNSRIHITKILQRVSKESLKMAKTSDVLFVFPTIEIEKGSCLVLKRPKTSSSVRELLTTEPLKNEIEARLKQIQRNKEKLGDQYHDYGLLICLENGNPIEPKLMMKWFQKWQKKQREEMGEDYPQLRFHDIRHSSATYYVEHCDGDFKSVQAVTGHKSLDVLLKIYAHATTPARMRLVETFQDKFYSGRKEQGLSAIFSPENAQEKDVVSTLAILAKDSPEIKDLLLKMCKQSPALQETVLTALLAG